MAGNSAVPVWQSAFGTEGVPDSWRTRHVPLKIDAEVGGPPGRSPSKLAAAAGAEAPGVYRTVAWPPPHAADRIVTLSSPPKMIRIVRCSIITKFRTVSEKERSHE